MNPTFPARLSPALLLLAACGSGAATAPQASYEDLGVEPPAIQAVAPLRLLHIPTYDGSGQAVHPDVVQFGTAWNGYEYWMAYTPYPGGNQQFENPSVVASHDGINWEVPPGLRNPLLPRAGNGGYNSDPDLSWDPESRRLVLLTRTVVAGHNRIKALWSADGITWTPPSEVFRRPNHGIISPAVVLRPGAMPQVWYVDGGNRKCDKRVTRVMHRVADGRDPLSPPRVEASWDRPRAAGLVQAGQQIWHLDVAWVEALQEYWAVYPAYPTGHCGARDLWFATSRDGMNWTTYRNPLLRHADADWTRAMLYRASTLYDASRDVARIYVSASAPGPVWRIGYVEFKRDDLFAIVNGTGIGVAGRRQTGADSVNLEEGLLP